MSINRPKSEEKILRFWKEQKVFEKSLDKKGKDFVFYEGPPTANAKPGVHHVLARAFKDIVCRYQTMRGRRVLRKAGWDVHGLPVELEVEKELGLKSKKQIEDYGIAKFNEKCQQSVWRYAKEWENLTQRIAYWLDLENPYITSDPLYMETVFNILKTIWDKGLLYQGHKVVPYCPRCGTGLSSHELALGYKRIKEPAIFIKYQISNNKLQTNSKFQIPSPKSKSIPNSQFPITKPYLLVWTTTPWTLPGNVAIAVNPKLDYILAKVGKEYLITAKDRKEALGDDFKIIKEFKGKDLVGLEYEPLFDSKIVAPYKGEGSIYKILAADFVTTDEGTGLVHIAPAFGADDLALIKAQREEFPILLTVDEQGKFKPDVKRWKGMFVKEADPLITEYLQTSSCLFKKEQYEHDYPFCWRCDTPLIYYAKKSWFIKTTEIKDKLLKNNQKINWVPEHIKQGRFGEWLKELKDWALSRERYWGTPLPVWRCGKCEHQEIIGSREDLKSQNFTTNKYFLLRHGEAELNKKEIFSCWPEQRNNPLTKQGIKEVEKAAKKLKQKDIDLIISSDLLRTKQSAEIIAKELGVKVLYDKDLREINVGKLNGRPLEEREKVFNPKGNLTKAEVTALRFKKPFPGGESSADIRKRVLKFIKKTDQRYKNKNILIVGHQLPLGILESSLKGETIKELAAGKAGFVLDTGQFKQVKFTPFPYNKKAELDFHRPFIDEIQLQCPKCGKKMKRVEEVIDCWFDSGSMPFAQGHWPFNDKLSIINNHSAPPELFPADYIAEAVDQTRGWFYTLLAISTLLGFGPSYKNVVCLGHILDEKGQKMSKSKGNVVDPWQMADKYGADALRWYLFTVNQPGEVKLFSEKDVDRVLKKFILTYWNCYTFFKTYVLKKEISNIKCQILNKFQIPNSKQAIDKWVISRLNNLIEETTEKLDKYDITGAGRAIENFVVQDLSLWYIRRSRQRFQRPKNKKEKKQATAVLAYTLSVLARITAPFVPFISEQIYANLGLSQSVHLQNWPKKDKRLINKKVEQKMELVREIVSLGLKIRSAQGLKVRQPLAKLKIKANKKVLDSELLDLLKQELNVKEIELVKMIKRGKHWKKEKKNNLEIGLNIGLSPALKEEGMLRELIRQIQQMRKSAQLKPKDKIKLYVRAGRELDEFLKRNQKEILSQTNAKEFIFAIRKKTVFDVESQFKIAGQKLWLGLKVL